MYTCFGLHPFIHCSLLTTLPFKVLPSYTGHTKDSRSRPGNSFHPLPPTHARLKSKKGHREYRKQPPYSYQSRTDGLAADMIFT